MLKEQKHNIERECTTGQEFDWGDAPTLGEAAVHSVDYSDSDCHKVNTLSAR